MREAAGEVLALARSRPPTLGRGRLVCVDGPAGAGKTSLAAALEPAGARVVHMDDLYDGWDGLPRVDTQLETLLRPMAAGAEGHYRRYDWLAAGWAETVTVPPGPLLVVEGVGAWAPAVADLVTVLVWVEAPPDLRLSRGLARDGEGMRREWVAWMAQEEEHLARTGARARADVRVDGRSGTVVAAG